MVASSYAEYYGGQANGNVATTGVKSGMITVPLIIGDDYLAANNRALSWLVDVPAGTTVDGSTARLTFVQASGYDPFEIVIEGTVELTAGGVYLQFEISAATTATITEGEYVYFVEWIGDSDEQITKVTNRQLVNWKNKGI